MPASVPVPANALFGMRNALLTAALLTALNGFTQESHSRLGVPAIHSSLGSPLWVKIPIEATDSTEEINTSRFSLGYKPASAAIPFVENAEISFERVGSQYFVVIRSRQAVDEPAVGIVVRERLPHGVRSREFIVLLDPPPALPTNSFNRSGDRNIDGSAVAAQSVQSIPATAAEKPATPLLSPPLAPPIMPTVSRGEIVEPAQAPTFRPKRAGISGSNRPRGESVTRRALASTSMPASDISTGIKIPPTAAAALPKKDLRADRRGPKLSLSLSNEILSARPIATEAERAVLRQRQLMLDLDDLTAALMDRAHRISLLEKELGNLNDRLSAAERLMSLKAAATATSAAPTSEPILPAGDKTAAANATPAPIPEVVAVPATPANTPPVASLRAANAGDQQWPLWKILLATITSLLLVSVVWLSGRRHQESSGRSSRIPSRRVDDDIEESLDRASAHRQAVTKAATQFRAAVGVTTQPTKGQASIAAASSPESPDMHFELPVASSETPEGVTDAGNIDPDVSTPAANTDTDDLRSRRLRYLQSRYHDIALLKPPLDVSAKLLRQAAALYDEGAVEFAKRLLKYAAYSRAQNEEFWLALLELLFREKFANDYVVNAKWFYRFHAQSRHWDEVQRIGYLLDSSEPLFASAAAWSHEEPAVGLWLPCGPAKDKAVRTLSQPPLHLKLELAS